MTLAATEQRRPRPGSWTKTHAVTTVTMRLAFRDKAGRDHYPGSAQEAGKPTSSDRATASFDAMEKILRSLLGLKKQSLSS